MHLIDEGCISFVYQVRESWSKSRTQKTLQENSSFTNWRYTKSYSKKESVHSLCSVSFSPTTGYFSRTSEVRSFKYMNQKDISYKKKNRRVSCLTYQCQSHIRPQDWGRYSRGEIGTIASTTGMDERYYSSYRFPRISHHRPR